MRIAVYIVVVLAPFVLLAILHHLFVWRAKAFEQLLNAKWRCRAIVGFPKIRGMYRGSEFEVSADPTSGSYLFILFWPNLPRQRRFMVSYPSVAPGVYQLGNKLQSGRYGRIRDLGRGFTKAEIAMMFDELIRIAEEIVRAQSEAD